MTYSRFLDEDGDHSMTANLIGELSESTYSGFAITRRGYMPDRGNLFNKVESTYTDKYTSFEKWLQSDEARGTLQDNLTRKVALVGSVSYAYKNRIY